jgi:hypothetical protein
MSNPTPNLLSTTTRIDQILSEFTNGFLMIGFHPITGEVMVVARTIDPKTCLAINAIMIQMLNDGGIVHQANEQPG